MKISSVLKTGVFIGLFWAGSALAQTWAPPAEIAPKQAQAAPGPTATAEQKPAATPDAKKDKAKDCKAQADAKGLHGKERKKFRAECVKA